MTGVEARKRLYVAVTNDLTYDQRMIRICNSLAGAGYRVMLIGRVLPDSVPLGQKPFGQHRMRCLFRKGPWFYLEYNCRLFFFLVRRKADLLVACDLDTAPAIVCAARIRRCLSAFDAHEYFTEVPELIDRNLVRKIWSAIGRFAVPKFDLRYTVNESLAGILGQKYGAEFGVIRNVPMASKQPIRPLSDREPVILYQGALNKGRGLEVLIPAMQWIAGYRLVIAGEGDLSVELRKLAKDHGLEDRVRFLGRVDPEALAGITAKAVLGLNLLDPESESYRYSLANKFFDYIQAGVPSVNPPFVEYERILAQYPVGVTHPGADPQQLASTIQALLADHPRMVAMIEACSEARQVYNWSSEEQTLLRMYSRLFEGKRD